MCPINAEDKRNRFILFIKFAVSLLNSCQKSNIILPVAMTSLYLQIDTRVAPVVGRVGPRKKKKKKKPAPQPDVTMVTGSANRKNGYDIWGTGSNTEVEKE